MKNRGYIIPDPIDPEETVCIRVRVPNHQLYIAAFMRAYQYFGQWVAWERDPTGKGAQAAAVWKSAIDETFADWNQSDGTCAECDEMDVRQSPTIPCVLEKLTGETWEQFADMRLCAPRMRVRNGVIQQDTTGEGDWVDTVDVETEAYDPRFDGNVTPPWSDPPSGQSGRCLSAANVAEYVELVAATIAGSMVAELSFFQVLSAAVTILASVIELVPMAILTAGITQVFTLVVDAWEGVRDFSIVSKLTEILLCKYNADGTMSRSNWLVVLQDIADWRATLSSNNQRAKWQLAYIAIGLWGPVGMGVLGKIWGIDSYECDEGDCHTRAFITFGDEPGDLAYTLVQGSIAGGGHPGMCLYSEGQNVGWGEISITLPNPVTVYAIGGDSKADPGPASNVQFVFYNSSNVYITDINTFPNGDGEWHTVNERPAVPITGVKRIRFLNYDTGGAFFHHRLDNFFLEYEE